MKKILNFKNLKMHELHNKNESMAVYKDGKFVYKLFDINSLHLDKTLGYLYEQRVYALLDIHFPDDERFVKATILSEDEVKAIDSDYTHGIKLKQFETQFKNCISEYREQVIQDINECCNKMKSIKLMHNDLHSLNMYVEDGRLRIIDWDCAYHDSIGINPRIENICPTDRIIFQAFVEDLDLELALGFLHTQQENTHYGELSHTELSDVIMFKTLHSADRLFAIPRNFEDCKFFQTSCGVYNINKDNYVIEHQAQNQMFSHFNDTTYKFNTYEYNVDYPIFENTNVNSKLKEYLIDSDFEKYYKVVFLFFKCLQIPNEFDNADLLYACDIYYNGFTYSEPEDNYIKVCIWIFENIKVDLVAFPDMYIEGYSDTYNYDIYKVHHIAKKLFIESIFNKVETNAFRLANEAICR